MKILHTADWHLGNTFHGYDRTIEHRHFLKWLLDTLVKEMPDVLVVAGNVYDTANPSAVAEGLFYDFLLQATEMVPGLQIVVIAGNHDSAAHIDAPAALLKRHNIYVRGAIKRHPDFENVDFDNLILPLSSRLSKEAEMVCLALPYLHPYDYPSTMNVAEGLQYYFDSMMRALNKTEFKELPIMAVAHFYAEGAEICENEHSEKWAIGAQEEIPTDIVGHGISYTALGHIHRCQKVESHVTQMYYAGSPLPMAFEEHDCLHGIQMVNMAEDGTVEVRHLGYSPLRRLLSIPSQGAATAKEIFNAIDRLPMRGKNERDDSWPYLEILVQEHQTDPDFFSEVTNALADKAVHFCKMVRETSDREKREFPQHHPSLLKIIPLDIARRIYSTHNMNDMPTELENRFKEAETLSLNSFN